MYHNPQIPYDRDQFIVDNMRLVHSVSNKFKPRIANNPSVQYEDLVAEGTIGLIKAYNDFNPNSYRAPNGKGVQFSTYAVPKIRGAILAFLRDADVIRVSRTYKEILAAMRVRNICEDESPEMIAKLIPYPARIIKEAIRYKKEFKLSSLQEPMYIDNEDSIELEETIGIVQDFDSRMILEDFACCLTDKERAVLREFLGGTSQEKTGETLGVSQAQISRIRKQIFNKARQYGKGLSDMKDKEKMIHLLKTTTMTYKEIAKLTGYSIQVICKHSKKLGPEVPKRKRGKRPHTAPNMAQKTETVARSTGNVPPTLPSPPADDLQQTGLLVPVIKLSDSADKIVGSTKSANKKVSMSLTLEELPIKDAIGEMQKLLDAMSTLGVKNISLDFRVAG